MRISDWSSDVCSSDLFLILFEALALARRAFAVLIVAVGRGFLLDLVLVLERDAGGLFADLAIILGALFLEILGRGVLRQHRSELADLAQLHAPVVDRFRPSDDRFAGHRACRQPASP